MDLLIYVGGAIAFFALVMASIALHEIGHLVPGKLFNVKTTEYFVGFGRKLWSRRRGETEYGVKAVPVGGYVRLVGMFPPAKSAHTVPAHFEHWPTTHALQNGPRSSLTTRAGFSIRSRSGRS
jgi:membrane-associated protease RseP (regulator of RpoE activity)